MKFVIQMSVFLLAAMFVTMFAAGWFGEQVAELLTKGTP